MNRFLHSDFHWPWPRLRAGAVALLASGGLLTTLTPLLVSPAYGQGSPQVTRYARVAYELEQARQRYYAQAKRALGGKVPNNVCEPNAIPDAVRGICDRFNRDTYQILEKYRMSDDEFKEMTRRQQSDPALQRQIQQEMMRIQRS